MGKEDLLGNSLLEQSFLNFNVHEHYPGTWLDADSDSLGLRWVLKFCSQVMRIPGPNFKKKLVCSMPRDIL